jgi:hypothetical protein
LSKTNKEKEMTKIFILAALFLTCIGCDSYTYPYLYDPYGYGYDAMQSVIGYRQDVMDWSNDAWDAYIRE